MYIDIDGRLCYNVIVEKGVRAVCTPNKRKEVDKVLIKYDKLFELMEKKSINKHYLRKHGIHAAVVDKLIKGGTIDTTTIGRICALLDCQPGDIMEYVPDEREDSHA